jgi:hypothetical protein
MSMFKQAMREAYAAGYREGDEVHGDIPDSVIDEDFEVFFTNYLTNIAERERKAREAYEAPISLTPTVTLPGPDWNELDEKIRSAFGVPREMFGMSAPPSDDARQTCEECGQTGVPIINQEGVEKCPWCGAFQ